MAKAPTPPSGSPEDQNARIAMKSIRQEIKRILDSWDPLSMRGLRGFDMQYHEFCGPIGVLVRKRVPPIDIAAHLDRLVQQEWRLPPCREQCLQIAEKIYRTGAFLDRA
ncbi:hypothetical protein BH09SUM1_BH09SUM1_10470 [soil metagenome]